MIGTAMAALTAAGLLAIPGQPGAPQEPPSPTGIVVTIDNPTLEVSPHSRTTYRITVRNTSQVDYPHALIAQMLPAELSYAESDAKPSKTSVNTLEQARSSEVQWVMRLVAGGQVSIDVTTAVGARPEKGVVSTTACVLPDGKTRPLICDTARSKVIGESFSPMWGAVGGVIVVGLGFLLWRFKRPKPRVASA